MMRRSSPETPGVIIHLLCAFCRLRGTSQYGDLHLGHTRGAGEPCCLGAHSCSQRSHLYPSTFRTIRAIGE